MATARIDEDNEEAGEPEYRNALALGTMLAEYRLDAVLGAGGFGMTYRGWDTHLEKNVAIKEYLPAELALRALDGSIVPVNTESAYNYDWGLKRFIQEARTLAKFSHPNIVRVHRYFEANGTSYMVMDYEAGESLHQFLKRAPAPPEAKLKSIVLPILDGLQAVHQIGFLHRDIKPSNVFMRVDDTPVLLDFGSARLAAGDTSRSLTAVITPGYAPLEQYSSDGNQGPWSDIYALSCVMFRAICGQDPPDPVSRLKHDNVPALLAAVQASYSERFLRTIEWGMSVDERMRPQSVAEWRDVFAGRAPMTALSRGFADPSGQPALLGKAKAGAVEATQAAAKQATRRAAKAERSQRNHGTWAIAGLASFVILMIVAGLWQHRGGWKDAPVSGSAEPAVAESSAEAPSSVAGPPAGPQDPARAAESGAAEPSPLPEQPVVRPAVPDTQISPAVLLEFNGADRDGDGTLSMAEVRGRFPFIIDNFATVDRDGDGRISVREFWELREKQRLRR